mmetsp:Transcript_13176/g.50449  ORF Transcript_13176/g.50449 Transcript_13176/m.50449 type:complete len:214 (-) Transcript_13176:194-835(-)
MGSAEGVAGPACWPPAEPAAAKSSDIGLAKPASGPLPGLGRAAAAAGAAPARSLARWRRMRRMGLTRSSAAVRGRAGALSADSMLLRARSRARLSPTAMAATTAWPPVPTGWRVTIAFTTSHRSSSWSVLPCRRHASATAGSSARSVRSRSCRKARCTRSSSSSSSSSRWARSPSRVASASAPCESASLHWDRSSVSSSETRLLASTQSMWTL